jgi:choline dehydrogenase-like flavoprotein
MSPGAIYPGSVITRDVEERPDVCIVGSGPGGSVLAAGLCARGLRVVMLEEGGYHRRGDYSLHEEKAFPMLYQEQGMRATADAGITILQGRTVGGGSVVNWTTSFRTPKVTLDRWARVHGVKGLDEVALTPHWEAVEKRLGVHDFVDAHNGNNSVLVRGCEALKFQVHATRRNTNNRCFNSGYCGFGCPVDGKNDMVVTYLPDAVAQGLKVYSNCRAERFEVEGGKVSVITATVIDDLTHQPTGRTVTVRPKVLVLSGGAINSPAILLRSGVNQNGQVGRRTFLHPVVAMASVHAKPIEPYFGAPQSSASHHFIERGEGEVGFFIETAPIHPMLASGAFQGFGVPHEELMRQLPFSNVLLGLTRDGFVDGDEGGTVTVKADGRPSVAYPISAKLQEAFREACKAMARIQFAAGATSVLTLTGVRLQSVDELGKLDGLKYGVLDQPLFSAHQMGGCAMGGDPARSVVDSQLRHHTLPNLFVVDGSVFPTSLGVNPQQSIYGLSSYATGFVAQAVG